MTIPISNLNDEFYLFFHDPGVFEASTLRGVHDKGVGVAREAGQAAFPHLGLFAGDDEGAQVCLAFDSLIALQDLQVFEVDHLLRDPTMGLIDDELLQLGQFLGGEVSPEDDTIAARLAHVFDHEAGEMVENEPTTILRLHQVNA